MAYPLPSYRHLPGMNARPEDGFLEEIANKAPVVTDANRFEDNEAWLYGLHLIENAFYWEAHEVLEPVWYNARPNSRERLLVQGLIQYANAALKLKMGRVKAAHRLAEIADRHLAEIANPSDDRLMGVSIHAYQCAIKTLFMHNNAFI